MAYNVSGLTDYVKANAQDAITDLILKGRSFELLRVEDDIKSSKKVPDISGTDVTLQDGDYTGVSGYNGGAVLKEINIAVKELFVKEKWTSRELQSKITQLVMKKGSNPEDLPYADILMMLKGEEMNLANENLLWMGDTAGSGNVSKFDGFIKQANVATDVIKTGANAVALTSSNAISEVEKFVNTAKENLPQFVNKETRLFMSPQSFQTYFRALYGLAAAINRDVIEGKPVNEIRVPGTNIIATSMAGMSGNSMILTRAENLIVGTDLVSEDFDINFQYHPLVKYSELFALYKLGAKIARTSEVIINKA